MTTNFTNALYGQSQNRPLTTIENKLWAMEVANDAAIRAANSNTPFFGYFDGITLAIARDANGAPATALEEKHISEKITFSYTRESLDALVALVTEWAIESRLAADVIVNGELQARVREVRGRAWDDAVFMKMPENAYYENNRRPNEFMYEFAARMQDEAR